MAGTCPFTVELSFVNDTNGKTAYYKQDGQRFDHPQTLKLNHNTDYVLGVYVHPHRQLLEVLIHGERYEVEMTETVKNEDDEEDGSKYILKFNTTGYKITKRKSRKHIPITYLFEDGFSLLTHVQCKFYPEDEIKHCTWGNPLTVIEYECEVTDGDSAVTVTRQRYL